MKTIDQVLKKLSMLYDFSKGLRSFTLPAEKNGALKARESTTAYATDERNPGKGGTHG
jgi:hypothetical protein